MREYYLLFQFIMSKLDLSFQEEEKMIHEVSKIAKLTELTE
jgi:hypothetical protein